MYFMKALIDFCLVLLLIRLLIRPNEAYFDPIYRLIYRITDPILVPVRYITRHLNKGILLILLALVLLRGLVYSGLGAMSLRAGVGISFLALFQLLFQAYMVMWFVSLLSGRSFGTSFLNLIQRAFSPLYRILGRFGVQRARFHLFAFLFLWVLYACLSTLIRYGMIPGAMASHLSPFYGFAEGLILVVGLFPFPGFFSLVIIAGALISWVNPDPSNSIVQAIYGISEPLLVPIRRYMPLLAGIDFSPIVALIGFQILGALVHQLIAAFMRGVL
ncbi:MAG: YggT family protein [Deltaproteobacteria bacterium]|nr:YggT family protein [Deltaproteobacteria bacterium]MBW2129926.1 YggT family protein [Deltaproteobacteria bacterium]